MGGCQILVKKADLGLNVFPIYMDSRAVQPTSEQKDAARDNHVIPCVRELSQVMSM